MLGMPYGGDKASEPNGVSPGDHVERPQGPDDTGCVRKGRPLASALQGMGTTKMPWSDSHFWRISLAVVAWMHASVKTHKLQVRKVCLLSIHYNLDKAEFTKGIPLAVVLRTDSRGQDGGSRHWMAHAGTLVRMIVAQQRTLRRGGSLDAL